MNEGGTAVFRPS
ncbi:hypothetical protein SPV_2527 [Streptococcus pneumoniae]|nr:hypothetical protein SPV_2527 [Streptococcus pneumoniae]